MHQVMTKDKFHQLAAYNNWANARLFAAALALSDQAYRLHIGAFFGSLHAAAGSLSGVLILRLNQTLEFDSVDLVNFKQAPS